MKHLLLKLSVYRHRLIAHNDKPSPHIGLQCVLLDYSLVDTITSQTHENGCLSAGSSLWTVAKK